MIIKLMRIYTQIANEEICEILGLLKSSHRHVEISDIMVWKKSAANIIKAKQNTVGATELAFCAYSAPI